MANHAVHCVFTNRSLFVTITQFVSGIPYFTHQVKQSLICASGAYKSDMKAQEDMELWQNAVITGDMQTLEALRVLLKTQKLGNRLQALLRGLSGFALLHTSDLAFVDWLDAGFPTGTYPFSHEEYMRLGEQGDVDVIKWLVRRKYRIPGEVLNGAARKGHLELLQFVHPRHVGTFSCAISHMKVAAAFGHLDVVRFFHETRQPCRHRTGSHKPPTALDIAAMHGNLSVVQYLHEQEPPSGSATTEAMDSAAENGHLDIVQFLHLNRDEGCTTQAMDDAVKNHPAGVVTFLREHHNESCSREAMESAVKDNDRP